MNQRRDNLKQSKKQSYLKSDYDAHSKLTPDTPPMEKRKRVEAEKVYGTMEQLIYPDMKNMYTDPVSGKVIAEDLGEYEGAKLKGLEPFWHDMKQSGKQHARDADSDIYEPDAETLDKELYTYQNPKKVFDVKKSDTKLLDKLADKNQQIVQ